MFLHPPPYFFRHCCTAKPASRTNQRLLAGASALQGACKPSFPADSLNPASISQLCGSAYLTACARSMGAKSYPPSKGCSSPDASGCVGRDLGVEGGACSEPGGLADPSLESASVVRLETATVKQQYLFLTSERSGIQ